MTREEGRETLLAVQKLVYETNHTRSIMSWIDDVSENNPLELQRCVNALQTSLEEIIESASQALAAVKRTTNRRDR
jgi:hypothetical protein